MNLRRINLILFSCVLFSIAVVSWLPESTFFAGYEKPWQLQPFTSEDSLSVAYKERYRVLDKLPVVWQMKDTTGAMAVILVDAWGVPLDESRLAEDFSFFQKLPHEFALHRRLANRTEHAENVEWKDEHVVVKCDSCGDSEKIAMLDSLLSQRNGEKFAMTVSGSRYGDRNVLHETLKALTTLAERYPDCKFIVQGTHRPMLGSPELRRSHLSHWAPVVILNAKLD